MSLESAVAIFSTSCFIFVRHGESVANREGLVAGRLDSPLTERGRDQAREAAELLAAHPPACIWTGTASRVRETAWIIGARFRLEPREAAGLRERDWGALEGRPLRERPLTGAADLAIGGESWEDYRRISLAALAGIEGPAPVLIVGHSGNYRVLREVLFRNTDQERIPNALPVLFERRAGGWRETFLTGF